MTTNQPYLHPTLIITAAHVLTCDDSMSYFSPGAIAISNETVVIVGDKKDILEQFPDTDITDLGNKVVMPGIVNTHTHVPMTLLRGLADDLRLDVWLMGYIMPVEREFVSPEMCYLGTKLACAELFRSGVTTFADMYYFEHEIAKATAEAGMRALCTESILKFPAPDAASYDDSLAYTREYIQEWQGHSLIVPGIAPHAPYTTTPEILKASRDIAVEYDVPFQIHLAETQREVEGVQAEYGARVIQYMHKQGVFEAKTLAAHCVHVDDSEIALMAEHNVGVLHNPTSNLKLASGVAPVQKMINAGVNVGVATDGPASNNDLDMFEEMRLAALLAKGINHDPVALPAKDAIRMATINGAKAIHMDHITGSLETGKRADLIAVDISTIHNAPAFRRDPNGIYAQLVYASKSTDVTDVMVNGAWTMRDKDLQTLDEDALLAEAAEFAHKVDVFLLERESSVRRKLVAIGGVEYQESFEVQAKAKITSIEALTEQLNDADKVTILKHKHYRQYDTYFYFDAPETDFLRLREDELVGEDGKAQDFRYRLTLIGPSDEQIQDGSLLISRSRYIAPSTHTLRFYREYFRPVSEHTVTKDRLRWRIVYRGVEFAVNIDNLTEPQLGHFLEIKSRTWSQRDAKDKAAVMRDLLALLGIEPEAVIARHYIDLSQDAQP